MKQSIKALLGTVALVSITTTPFCLAQSAQAEPVDPINNIVQDVGPTITLPGATVTIKVPVAPVTIKVPGPTVSLPQQTVTVPAPPQPTMTVTKTVTEPGETKTVVVPSESQRLSEPDSVAPRPTQTVTVKNPRQRPAEDATLDPAPQQPNTDDDASTSRRVITKVVYVTVATIIVGLLGILAMFFGYVLGRKDAERNDVGFLRSLVATVRDDYR